tara:strand:+ start:7616 stop:8674 length:1059 start_codon:yes stop_codon:yes gene_type:complete
MSNQIVELNIDQLDAFYEVGTRVRARNNTFELPWSETKNIDVFFNENAVPYKLFSANNENGEGRIAAYQFEDTPESGYLGWYECDPDDALANELLGKSKEWLISLGVTSISGPMNGSSWGSFRFNTIADKPLFATEPYQPLYYVKHWESAGFKHDVIYETHIIPKEISRPMPYWKVKMLVFFIGARFNKWPKNFIQDEHKLKDMHSFFHECFGDNPLYRPVTFDRYKEITVNLEAILDFDHSYLVTDKKGKPVSVLVSYKDVYHQMYKEGKLKDGAHNTHTLYMKTIATAKAWRGKHISRVLVNFGFVQAYKNGYSEVVFGTMMAENKSAQYSKSFFKAETHRSYSFMKIEI